MNKKNSKNKKESLRIIYDEVLRARDAQEKDIKLIYNKFNWILVSNVVLLTTFFQIKKANTLTFFGITFLFLSTTISLYSLNLTPFKRGPILNELEEAKDKKEEVLLNALNKKIIKDIYHNKKKVKIFGLYLYLTVSFLIMSIILISTNIIII